LIDQDGVAAMEEFAGGNNNTRVMDKMNINKHGGKYHNSVDDYN
jgi:hypothetical protein